MGSLLTAMECVADHFGTRPVCVDVAATGQTVGRLLGYELRPRPVTLLAHDASSGAAVVLGSPAGIPELAGADLSGWNDLRPEEQGDSLAGHVVLTADQPSPILIDASLDQLAAFGIPAAPLALNISSASPPSGRWTAEVSAVTLVYVLQEADRRLLVRFDDAVRAWSGLAREIVDYVTSAQPPRAG